MNIMKAIWAKLKNLVSPRSSSNSNTQSKIVPYWRRRSAFDDPNNLAKVVITLDAERSTVKKLNLSDDASTKAFFAELWYDFGIPGDHAQLVILKSWIRAAAVNDGVDIPQNANPWDWSDFPISILPTRPDWWPSAVRYEGLFDQRSGRIESAEVAWNLLTMYTIETEDDDFQDVAKTDTPWTRTLEASIENPRMLDFAEEASVESARRNGDEFRRTLKIIYEIARAKERYFRSRQGKTQLA